MQGWIDESRFPIVHVRFPERPTIEWVNLYFVELERIADIGEFVLIIDLRRVLIPSVTARIRKQFFDLGNAFDVGKGKEAFLGEAIVFRNPLMRMLVQSYFWMKVSESYPTRTVSSVQEAEVWAKKLLALSSH